MEENALLAKKINLDIGIKQPWMRNGFNNAIQQMQPILLLDNNAIDLVWDKSKRLKQVLTERDL